MNDLTSSTVVVVGKRSRTANRLLSGAEVVDGGIETHVSLHVHTILQVGHDPLDTNLKECPCLLRVVLVGKDGGDGRHFEGSLRSKAQIQVGMYAVERSERPTRKDVDGQDTGEGDGGGSEEAEGRKSVKPQKLDISE